ncbi:GNAT family N-acetyltransferase [Gordonia terrae]|uniref:GNAT family N-acetyltransferase n=1 Tax=Gordonia terrae TaxID=2055 RepID=UPI003F6B7547
MTDPAAAAAVADVAARTFPLACPPHATPDDITGFIENNLRENNFREHITAPQSDVLVARDGVGGPIVGYALILHREPTDPDVCAVVTDRPVTEVSKLYVLPDHHSRPGASPSRLLMTAALERARSHGSSVVWLGVNQENARAQRFYAKMDFTRVGEKTFTLGSSTEHDYVLTREL